jgi:hypothetical protein
MRLPLRYLHIAANKAGNRRMGLYSAVCAEPSEQGRDFNADIAFARVAQVLRSRPFGKSDCTGSVDIDRQRERT